MIKLNFISNPRIILFIHDTMNMEEYASGKYIRPDQIPEILLDGLYNALRDDVILSLSIFAWPDDDFVRIHVTIWDGICCMGKVYRIFGDGSYDRERDESGNLICDIL